MAAKLTDAEPTTVYRLKASTPVMNYMAGKAEVRLFLPNVFAPGYRLFMQGWEGAPTGRARLLKIIGYEGDLTVLYATCGWSRDKLDTDLKELGLTITPMPVLDGFNPEAVITARVIPQ